MKKIPRTFLALCFAASVSACGGGGSGNVPDSAPSVLTPGTTYTMVSDNSVLVPAGTTVTANGNVTTVTGANTTTNTVVGAVVYVPPTATGSADNTVTTQ